MGARRYGSPTGPKAWANAAISVVAVGLLRVIRFVNRKRIANVTGRADYRPTTEIIPLQGKPPGA